jgi:hypothetical protein
MASLTRLSNYRDLQLGQLQPRSVCVSFAGDLTLSLGLGLCGLDVWVHRHMSLLLVRADGRQSRSGRIPIRDLGRLREASHGLVRVVSDVWGTDGQARERRKAGQPDSG